MSKIRVALVTGSTSGIGEVTARYLVDTGYRVFGTSRKNSGHSPIGCEMLTLDVRSNESVRSAVAQVVDASGRIDLLVNNAGALQTSLVEETDLENARHVFETNFFGVVRMTQAVLPNMRKRRSGRIINVGSLAGIVGVPGLGFYSASKFALEGFSEALRHELQPFNVKVSVIEPGFFKTNLVKEFLQATHKVEDYDAIRDEIISSTLQSVHNGPDPKKVAALIVRVAQEDRPKLRYRVGYDATWVPRFKTLLPEAVFAFGVRQWVKRAAKEPN